LSSRALQRTGKTHKPAWGDQEQPTTSHGSGRQEVEREKKPKKPKPIYSNTMNNYQPIRNMVTYPSDTAAQEASTGKKKVSIGI
jgi:hypothetical protein